MATESEHRRQAERNEEFLSGIDQNRFPDWKATVAFYKAVHLVEMLLAHLGRPAGGSHTRRNNTLKRDFPDLWREYRPLYAFSMYCPSRNRNLPSRELAAILLRR